MLNFDSLEKRYELSADNLPPVDRNKIEIREKLKNTLLFELKKFFLKFREIISFQLRNQSYVHKISILDNFNAKRSSKKLLIFILRWTCFLMISLTNIDRPKLSEQKNRLSLNFLLNQYGSQ